MKEPKQPIPISKLDDPDMQAVPIALYRAARRAHKIAQQHKTGVVVMRDGEVIEIEPDPDMYEEKKEK